MGSKLLWAAGTVILLEHGSGTEPPSQGLGSQIGALQYPLAFRNSHSISVS